MPTRLFISLIATCFLTIKAHGAFKPIIDLESQIIDLPQSEDSWDDITDINCDSSAHSPRYPIVLLHGFMGFDKILRVEYFYRIKGDYRTHCAKVFTTNVNPLNTVQLRAKELAPQIDGVLQQTKSEKINIIAHSMGGLDARYLISSMGFENRVASLTTIGTPHKGSPVPEYVWKFFGKGNNPIFKAVEFLIYGATSSGKRKVNEISLNAALWNLTPKFLNTYFNPNNPNSPSVYYQSYAGISGITGIKAGDIIDPLLILFQPSFIGTGYNDGLVPIDSAKWGEFKGIVRADHIDLIGQVFGTTSKKFNHRKFYKIILSDLAKRGF